MPLVLRSILHRPSTVVLLFSISAAAVLTSVLGPLVSRAVHESALDDALSAEPAAAAIAVRAPLDRLNPTTLDHTPVDTVDGVLGAGRAAEPDLWQEPTHFLITAANVGWLPSTARAGTETIGSRVTASESPCRGFVLSAGTCPAAAGQVLLSDADGRQHEVGVGSTVILTAPDSAPLRLRVTGLYDPERSDQAPLLRPGTDAGALAQVTGDPLVVTTDQAQAINLPYRVQGRLLLRPDRSIAVADEPALRATVAAIMVSMAGQSTVLEFDTDLDTLLDRVDAQSGSAGVLITVIVLQAVALALFTLAIVLQRVARARSAEWSLGRLRGIRRTRWLGSIYLEPALALLLGAPVGLALGVLGAGLIAARELRPGTPVDAWRGPVLLAAGAAVLGALAALVAVSLRSVRRPLVEQIQQASESRRSSVPGAVAQAAVVVLAAASLYQLLTGGALGSTGSRLGLLAPAACAFALAVMVVRVVVIAVGRITARPARGRAALVVGRRAARVPSSLNPAVVIAAGLALALFAGQTWWLSSRNQDLKAAATVGAGSVLTVTVPPEVDLIAAVDRADPGGHQAMAAMERIGSSNGGTSRIVAVDSDRFAAVTTWRPEWSDVEDLVGSLQGPSRTAPVMLHGSQVTVRLTDVRVGVTVGVSPGSGRAFDIPVAQLRPPSLSLILDTGAAWEHVPLGPVGGDAGGDGIRRSAIHCATACRVVGFQLESSEGSAYQAGFVVAEIRTDADTAASIRSWLTDPHGWQQRVADQDSPAPVAGAAPAADPGGLSVRAFDQQGGLPTMVSRTDATDPMPALLGPTVQQVGVAGLSGVAYGTGLPGLSQLIEVAGRAQVLPRSLDDGVLVDLRNARWTSDPSQNQAVSEVWLAPGASGQVVDSLRRQGIRVQSVERLADVRADLRAQAVTRGTAVAGWVGYAALLLALAGLVASRVADAVRRRADWASLRDAGLPARAVRGLTMIEVSVPALVGVVIGVAAGLLAIVSAAPRLPLVDQSTPGPPLDLHPAYGPMLIVVGVTAAIVLVIAGAAGLVEGRSRRSER
ncbi:FtsX-like permease family protein [Microlunatus ginsengisoli]|uniref:ABC3 transporter permease C-terminal domain-containing protein n=1 Tax=Microlunatus ginsengisoli TaxID=363863 RepID=A0ABP6ZNX8_9ACTN